jgi:hypothetical protein
MDKIKILLEDRILCDNNVNKMFYKILLKEIKNSEKVFIVQPDYYPAADLEAITKIINDDEDYIFVMLDVSLNKELKNNDLYKKLVAEHPQQFLYHVIPVKEKDLIKEVNELIQSKVSQ